MGTANVLHAVRSTPGVRAVVVVTSHHPAGDGGLSGMARIPACGGAAGQVMA